MQFTSPLDSEVNFFFLVNFRRFKKKSLSLRRIILLIKSLTFMRSTYKDFIFLLLFCFALFPDIQAQTEKQRMVFKAMNDELQRNMDNLSIANWEKPFFIQYAMQEGRLFQVQATLGAITGVNEFL